MGDLVPAGGEAAFAGDAVIPGLVGDDAGAAAGEVLVDGAATGVTAVAGAVMPSG